MLRLPRRTVGVLAAFTLAVPAGVALDTAAAAPVRAADDAVVIAVIDSGMSPYHLDYRATQMPQAKTPSKADDLPLGKAPHTWLPGFPKPSAFDTYAPLRLTLPDDRNADMAALQKRDADAWSDVEQSKPKSLAYSWIPGTKVIGAMSFGPKSGVPIYGTGGPEHGMGTSSVAVGNTYGTCPECLLVFLQATSSAAYEEALSWAMNQPWIDAVSNSYGISTTGVLRDRVYNGSDVELMRTATERGQTVFFSAGNGVMNDFVTPNATLLSSQEGPDWLVTVGATDPTDVDYSGSGKPADIAGIGTMYPSSYSAKTVSGNGNFSGTSNATPTIAGTYGRALWLARKELKGASRVQAGGVIARGAATCGPARRSCELGDGALTRRELQARLFEGATPTKGGFAGRRTVPGSVLGLVPVPAPVGGAPVPFVTTPAVADERMASEGYGTYRARLDGTAKWQAEFNGRLWDVLRGAASAPKRPEGEVAWFRVDSQCRQHIWGAWKQGAYVDDARTPLPSPDPVAWPTRTVIQVGCPALTAPPEA